VKTVVVGAGAAGLWAALHAVEQGPVVLVAPDPSAGSATALAQGGIAAAVAEGDDPAAHAEDTLTAGAGLCDREAVHVLTAEAPDSIAELVRRGMAFDAGGRPTLEGGHRARRVLHAGGDATGRFLLQALLAAADRERRVVWDRGRVAALLPEGGAVRGVRRADGAEVEGDRTILATGGACGIYGRRTGPDHSTGHGLALAWDAGAALADLEFVQFHPTALDVPGHAARLLTEALRGEGGRLVDPRGRRFMADHDPRGDLAPRDVVSRAIAAVRAETGRVFLDATGIDGVRERFPTAAATCDAVGLDLARDPVPVAPAAHYFIGGVLTDLWGRTTVPGLSACGEVASTGVHGANRLASNSLLETLVFGRRAALAPEGTGPSAEPEDPYADLPGTTGPSLEDVRSVADAALGVRRDAPTLEAALRYLATSGGGGAHALVARLVARAALRREESRGAHFRDDHPRTVEAWRRRQVVSPLGWCRLPVAS